MKNKRKLIILGLILFALIGIYCVEMQKELSYVSKEREGKFNIYYARLEEEKNIDLAYKYDANVVPTTVFLDKEGNKFYVHQGLMRKNNIETILNSLGVK